MMVNARTTTTKASATARVEPSSNYHSLQHSAAAAAAAETTRTASCDWKPGTIILEASKNVLFSVPPLAEKAWGTQSQQREREQDALSITTEAAVSASTKTYWHQVIVKDFQWLRKGIASPNFQIEVLSVNDTRSEKYDQSIKESFDELDRPITTLIPTNYVTNDFEDCDSSDSEDEL